MMATFRLNLEPKKRVFARFYCQMFRELAKEASAQEHLRAIYRIKACEHSQFTIRDIAEISHMLGKTPKFLLEKCDG